MGLIAVGIVVIGVGVGFFKSGEPEIGIFIIVVGAVLLVLGVLAIFVSLMGDPKPPAITIDAYLISPNHDPALFWANLAETVESERWSCGAWIKGKIVATGDAVWLDDLYVEFWQRRGRWGRRVVARGDVRATGMAKLLAIGLGDQIMPSKPYLISVMEPVLFKSVTGIVPSGFDQRKALWATLIAKTSAPYEWSYKRLLEYRSSVTSRPIPDKADLSK